jgi:SOS response regulatory protein OraA/RecX
MPRKQLSPPDENRRRAVRLTDGEAPSKQRFEDLSYPSELDTEDFVSDTEIDEGAQAGSVTKKGKMSAEGYASYLLSIKTYTERGLREKMRNRGYGCDETDEAVEKMKRLGFLCDLRAAENAASRLAERLYGKRRIFAYLSSKGIGRETLDALDLCDVDFFENCKRAAEKLLCKGGTVSLDAKGRLKLRRSLYNLGFSGEEISYALEELFPDGDWDGEDCPLED